MEHDLKCLPEHYDAIESGAKTLELRLDDRNYQTGDILHLRRYEPLTEAYTGASQRARVTHTLRGGPWLTPGYVAMSIKRGADELAVVRDALAGMVTQYMQFPEGYISHEFMGAQEDAIEYLEQIGWLRAGELERYYWTDVSGQKEPSS